LEQRLTATEEQMQRQLEQPVQIDKRQWWNQLDDNWKTVFKKAISINGEPTDSDLEKIVHLQELDFSGIWDNRRIRIYRIKEFSECVFLAGFCLFC
jgi:hypothetical protein